MGRDSTWGSYAKFAWFQNEGDFKVIKGQMAETADLGRTKLPTTIAFVKPNSFLRYLKLRNLTHLTV